MLNKNLKFNIKFGFIVSLLMNVDVGQRKKDFPNGQGTLNQMVGK